ncbi:MAG: DUF58 domain-containing protein [Bacteroidales bacterium]|nr:DUF58 domain-containing protein [Bacteroidales bacterium]
MDAKELLSKIHRIEIKTRGLTSQVFAGEYHSAFKGQGMAFSEVREYQYGDPIRNIDWNVTARFNHPFIKVFEEERELTVMLLVDVSGSNDFGTADSLKREFMTEVAAVIAFSAIQNNDKIGVIFFTDKVEKFIPPKKGKKHIMRIILELLDFQPENKNTDVTEALKYFTNAIKKRCTAFLLSDYIQPGVPIKDLQNSLTLANKKHDLVGLIIKDEGEFSLPNIGLVQMNDPETGKTQWVDTSDKKLRRELKNWWDDRSNDLTEAFRKSGVDFASLQTSQDYVQPLIKLFKKRGHR